MALHQSTITAIGVKSKGKKPKKFSNGAVQQLKPILASVRGQPGSLNLINIRDREDYKTLGGSIGFKRRAGTVATPTVVGGTIQATSYGVFNPMMKGRAKIAGNNGRYLKY